MPTIQAFDDIGNKHTLYREKTALKKLCESLREYVKNIIYSEKIKVLPSTKGKIKLHQDARNHYMKKFQKIFKKLSKSIHYQKVRYHCHYTGQYRGAAHNICNLKFNVPN